MQGACGLVRGLGPHVSTGLGTMLLGVSGSCEDREVTSLPEELPREPDSEKETWRPQGGALRCARWIWVGALSRMPPGDSPRAGSEPCRDFGGPPRAGESLRHARLNPGDLA